MAENRLVCVSRTRKSKELLVSFNSYENPAFRKPALPHETHLENYSRFINMDANVIWYAEEFYSWYLRHERRIIDTLVAFVAENGIRRISMTGASAGGFAAIRIAAILNRLLDQKGIKGIPIHAIGINCQSGFRTELIERVTSAMKIADWPAHHLGRNPPLLGPSEFQPGRAYHPECDLRFVVKAHGFGAFRAFLFYDRLNPIDRIFAEDLEDFPQVALTSLGMRAHHGAGCIRLSRDPALSVMLDSILALPMLPAAQATQPTLA